MQKATKLLVTLVTVVSLSGCIVRSGPRYGSRSSHSRACPPAYHWEGGACVHNGRGHARGHRK